MTIKRIILTVVCVFLLFIGYCAFAQPKPEADDSIAYEVFDLLIVSGYDITMNLYDNGLENTVKTASIHTFIPEDFELNELAAHPEYFFIDILLYATENDAIIKTGQFNQKGDVYLGNNGIYSNLGFFAATHYYQTGNAIVRYCGSDPALRELLEAQYGEQFAGD